MHVPSCMPSPCVCPLRVYVPSECMSPPCVCSFVCMSTQCVCPLHMYVFLIVPSCVTHLHVYIPPCVHFSVCMFILCVISHHVYVSFCFSLRVYDPSACMSPSLVYFPSVFMSLRMFVSSCMSPRVCMCYRIVGGVNRLLSLLHKFADGRR